MRRVIDCARVPRPAPATHTTATSARQRRSWRPRCRTEATSCACTPSAAAVKAQPSNEVRVDVGPTSGCTPPIAPTNLRATVTGNVVTLMWNGAPGAISYVLEACARPVTRQCGDADVERRTRRGQLHPRSRIGSPDSPDLAAHDVGRGRDRSSQVRLHRLTCLSCARADAGDRSLGGARRSARATSLSRSGV